jgi:hypothetical protein
MREKNKDETLDHLITTSHQQQLDDRRSNFEQSKHYRESKRKNVLSSLFVSNDNEAVDLGWKLEKCRKYNINRYYHPTRRVLGPWWNRVIKDHIAVCDPKEQKKYKLLLKQRMDNEIDNKTYIRKCRKLKWERIDTNSDVRKDFSTFRNSIDEVNTRALNRYLQKTSTKKPCQSLWCSNCRFVAKESYLKKVQTHISRGRYLDNGTSIRQDITTYFTSEFHGGAENNPSYNKFDYNNKDIRHVTGVVGLFPIDSDVIKELLKGDEKNKWKRIKRRLSDYNIVPSIHDPWFEGVYEFELVNWKFLKSYRGNKDQKKVKTIEGLKRRDKVGNTFLFVHFHGLTNLTKDEITKVFQKEYWIDENTRVHNTHKDSGLYVQSLRSNQSFKDNIEKLSSYPFKDPYRYKHTFIGDDYSNGEPFTKKELRQMIKLYQNVQGNNWKSLFRSLSISNIVERDMYGKYYIHKHPVWEIMDRVWIVDSKGYVFLFGWNPDQHPSFNKVNVVEKVIDRSASGKKYGYYKHMLPYKLLIYSNIYDDKSYYTKLITSKMTLWEYYHSIHTGESGDDEDIREKYRLQQIGYRNIVSSYTSFDINDWGSFLRYYESVKEYNWVLKNLGIPQKSLKYKNFLKIKEKTKGLGYISQFDHNIRHKETKIFDKDYYDIEKGEVVEGIEETREVESSYEEWLVRERFDTLPIGFRKSILDECGYEDEEVREFMDRDILNGCLKLTTDNNVIHTSQLPDLPHKEPTLVQQIEKINKPTKIH